MLGLGKKKQVTFSVGGMMCEHCQKRVKEALEAVEGVKEVTVDLENKTATVSCLEKVTEQQLKKAVTDAGYRA